MQEYMGENNHQDITDYEKKPCRADKTDGRWWKLTLLECIKTKHDYLQEAILFNHSARALSS